MIEIAAHNAELQAVENRHQVMELECRSFATSQQLYQECMCRDAAAVGWEAQAHVEATSTYVLPI